MKKAAQKSLIAAFSLFIAGSALQAESPSDSPLEQVRHYDRRFAAIGYRLSTANASLCDRIEPATGMVLHSIDQYPDADAARRHFGFSTPVAMEAVLPESPAARLGLRQDTGVVAIAGQVLAALPATKPTDRIAATHALIARQPVAGPLPLRIEEAGTPRDVALQPVPACRSRFELTFGRGYDAQADGELVQIGGRFLEEYDDTLVAVVTAHELAHNILRHRERLDAVGVAWGMLSGIGRNVRYFRQVEMEADLLGTYLLANAGYDPALAARFWRTHRGKGGAGIFTDRTHINWKDRATRLDQEAARIAAMKERPIRPAILDNRSIPLDGNWRILLSPPPIG